MTKFHNEEEFEEPREKWQLINLPFSKNLKEIMNIQIKTYQRHSNNSDVFEDEISDEKILQPFSLEIWWWSIWWRRFIS